MNEHVTVPRDALLSIARDLNAIVVSLDRIGSRRAETDLTAEAIDVLEFLDTWKVFDKLSRARRVLNDALLRGADREEQDRIEEQLDAGPYWPDGTQ